MPPQIIEFERETAVESADNIYFFVGRSEKYDRYTVTASAHVFAYFKSRAVGKHDIEYEQAVSIFIF